MNRYYQLSSYWRHRYGARIQKIPLDAGFTCPNRDGTLSHSGCVFCNPGGSGSGLARKGLTLPEQWAHWQGIYGPRHKSGLYIAYLQSFSNTYGPLEKLEGVLSQIEGFTGVVGAGIGTRPDCLDEQRLDRIARSIGRIDAALAASGIQPQGICGKAGAEVWLELGLQSSSDATLRRINRGHDFACFVKAVHMAHERGLKVCAHLIAGLPGETGADFARTVADVAALPVAGVKFHGLYVAEHTAVAAMWRSGEYRPMEMEEYAQAVASGLAVLPAGVVIHRLTGDAAEGELLAPAWSADKRGVIARIEAVMRQNGLWQGCRADAPHSTPLWFSQQHMLPAAMHDRWRRSVEEHCRGNAAG
ncbi:TIGR01212 family radical SAM protein [Oleidesulfovibrio alaskensis]|jgi:radical SAM superfamily enzyme|uniref:TIGR01212 family radical SAM protein n=1 Tax=Oleidesulfovibrio alaskensis TaxID=58180 RepID=UPI0004007816|nr:radical SAM protein [Oleidesulfovibrio alaskensis]